MNKEENDNHILIEVLNKNGDLKLTKFRNPRVIFQNNDYPDEYIFRDVDIVNIFQLLQENQEYKRLGFKHLNDKCNKLEKENKILRENAEHNDKVVDKVNWENQKIKKQLEEYKLITIDYQELEARNQKLKKQQKEFVEWLESYLKLFDNKDIYEEGSYDTIEEILSKYREIIKK